MGRVAADWARGEESSAGSGASQRGGSTLTSRFRFSSSVLVLSLEKLPARVTAGTQGFRPSGSKPCAAGQTGSEAETLGESSKQGPHYSWRCERAAASNTTTLPKAVALAQLLPWASADSCSPLRRGKQNRAERALERRAQQ